MQRYTNSAYADAFRIDSQKWKRHVRGILPPDPGSGRQRGVARTLSIEEAFKVWWSVYLASSRRLSIPETKMVIDDLVPWLEKKEIFPSLKRWNKNRIEKRSKKERDVIRWDIVFKQDAHDIYTLHYFAKGIISNDSVEDDQFGRVERQEFIREEIETQRIPTRSGLHTIEYVLNLSGVVVGFLDGIRKVERDHIGL